MPPAVASGAGRAIGIAEMPPAGRTLKCLEEMPLMGSGGTLAGMKLEELLAGVGTAKAAENAELAVVDVGNVGAAVLAGATTGDRD